MKKIKIVYIAGKFRAKDGWELANNIRRAEEVGYFVACLGAMPLIPHANTHVFDRTLSDEFWLRGTLELLERSDAVMTVPNWVESQGAKAEVDYAREHNIPVFHHIDVLKKWLEVRG